MVFHFWNAWQILSTSGTPSFTASDFLDMLTSKTDRLRATTMDAPSPQFSTTSTFVNFRPVLESDLRSVLSAVNLKSCELDPLPPFIIVELLDDVAPFCSMFLAGLSGKAIFRPRRSEL